jgi:hypothetical protein
VTLAGEFAISPPVFNEERTRIVKRAFRNESESAVCDACAYVCSVMTVSLTQVAGLAIATAAHDRVDDETDTLVDSATAIYNPAKVCAVVSLGLVCMCACVFVMILCVRTLL